MTVVLLEIKANTLQVQKQQRQNCLARGMESLMQMDHGSLEAILDIISFPYGTSLHVDFEGRKPRCLLWGDRKSSKYIWSTTE